MLVMWFSTKSPVPASFYTQGTVSIITRNAYIIIIIADVPEWYRALDNKAKWLVQQYINGESSNPVDENANLPAQDLILTVLG
jgi:hypothetical protein